MENLKDEELMEMFCNGNTHAFHLIYDRYKNRIFRFISNTYEKDRNSAEDCVQEVFIRLIKNKNTFNVSMRFPTWIYTVARNICLNRIRARAGLLHFELLDNDMPDKSDSSGKVVRQELYEIIRKAVSELPEKLKAVFIMRELDEISYEDIAGIIGSNEGNIRTLFHRAKKELQKIIKPYIEGEK